MSESYPLLIKLGQSAIQRFDLHSLSFCAQNLIKSARFTPGWVHTCCFDGQHLQTIELFCVADDGYELVQRQDGREV